ncbi:LysE family translocator [Oceanobacter kriegii]|uniref:LysE family translocator n=1 Tax=Oceanobacter kriegii TaxID=64972 RepID=UPI0003FCC0D8|nr:LysE family translocator [Oceanobacter kriegii]
MPGIHDLTLFLISVILLNLTPGPDSLLVMSRTAMQGMKGGVQASIGVTLGSFVHVLAATFGLSVIIANSATAFTVIKLLGAAYLIYMGITALLAKPATNASQHGSNTVNGNGYSSQRNLLLQGFLSNALNPKVALFFLAFVPQFIDSQASATDKTLGFLILGCLFSILTLINGIGLTAASRWAQQRIRPGQRLSMWLNKSIGALFVAFGVKLALTSRN